MTRFISIISTAPGTGKTMLALNLGLALHRKQKKVVVFDADFSKPNMISELHIEQLPTTMSEVFDGQKHIFDAIYTHPSGLRIIPSLTSTAYDKISQHLQELLANYDFVIIDLPSQQKEIVQVLKELQLGDSEAIILHSPQQSSKYILDAQTLLRAHRILNLGIVLNQSHKDSVDSIFEIPVIAKIPSSKQVMLAAKQKHPVIHIYPRCPCAKVIMQIGERLV